MGEGLMGEGLRSDGCGFRSVRSVGFLFWPIGAVCLVRVLCYLSILVLRSDVRVVWSQGEFNNIAKVENMTSEIWHALVRSNTP